MPFPDSTRESDRTAGIVLCGGRSSRMGTAKHLLPFGDRTMLQVVVDTLRTVVSPVVVVRSAGQNLPELPADVLVTEDAEPDLGPLAGICAGMTVLGDTSFSRDSESLERNVALTGDPRRAPLRKASESRLNGRDAAFVTSCDTPLLQPDVIRFLIAERGNRDAAVVRDGEFLHVLAAVYSVRLLPGIRELLRERRLRLQGLVESCDARTVETDEIRRFDPHLQSFRNANTPQDYAELLRIAGLPTDQVSGEW